MQDDPLLFDYNVEERVNDFVAAAVAQVHLLEHKYRYIQLSVLSSFVLMHFLCGYICKWASS